MPPPFALAKPETQTAGNQEACPSCLKPGFSAALHHKVSLARSQSMNMSLFHHPPGSSRRTCPCFTIYLDQADEHVPVSPSTRIKQTNMSLFHHPPGPKQAVACHLSFKGACAAPRYPPELKRVGDTSGSAVDTSTGLSMLRPSMEPVLPAALLSATLHAVVCAEFQSRPSASRPLLCSEG